MTAEFAFPDDGVFDQEIFGSSVRIGGVSVMDFTAEIVQNPLVARIDPHPICTILLVFVVRCYRYFT